MSSSSLQVSKATPSAKTNVQYARTKTLVNAAMFCVGFQFTLVTAVSLPLVQRCLTSQYGEAYMRAYSGRYMTMLIAASYAANALSNPIWGAVADRHGRRPVLLLSLMSAAIALLMFGWSSSFAQVILARVASGLMDSSMAAAKVIIGDVSDVGEQARDFADLYLWFAVSLCISPAVVTLFAENASWATLAPCGLAAITTFGVCAACWAYLPETRLASSSQSPRGDKPRALSFLANRDVAMTVGLYAFLACVMCVSESLTALLILQPAATGGLGLESVWISRMYALQGVMYIVAQRWLCSPFVARFGAVVAFRLAVASLVVVLPSAILSAWLPDTNGRIAAFAAFIIIRICCISVATTSSVVLVNNSTASRFKGSVNGVAQSLAAASRAAGLILIGYMFDLSLRLNFIAMSFLAVGTGAATILAITLALSPSLATPTVEPLIDDNEGGFQFEIK